MSALLPVMCWPEAGILSFCSCCWFLDLYARPTALSVQLAADRSDAVNHEKDSSVAAWPVITVVWRRFRLNP